MSLLSDIEPVGTLNWLIAALHSLEARIAAIEKAFQTAETEPPAPEPPAPE